MGDGPREEEEEENGRCLKCLNAFWEIWTFSRSYYEFEGNCYGRVAYMKDVYSHLWPVYTGVMPRAMLPNQMTPVQTDYWRQRGESSES